MRDHVEVTGHSMLKKEVQIVIVILQLMQHRKRKGAGANLFTRTGVFLSKYWDKPKYWGYGCNN